MAVTLSLAMIVKNEEKLLRDVLRDASEVCDEMIVVDTGSTDETKSIAEAEGAVVHDITWSDDFAAARNASFALCKCDWIIWLDGDDALPLRSKETIAGLKKTLDEDVDVVLGPYHCRMADNDTVVLQVTRERMIRRESGLRWEGWLDEIIPIPEKRVMHAPGLVVEHRPNADRTAQNRDRHLRLLESEVAKGHPSARTLFYYANELFDHGRYEEAALNFRCYLGAEHRPGNEDYWAYVRVAECERNLGHDQQVIDAASKAIAFDPSRAEAYVSMGRVFFDRQQWAEAAPLFLAATGATAPTRGLVRVPEYRYWAWDFLSVCLDSLGRRHEALDAAMKALQGNPESERVRANMRWMADHL